MVICFNNDGIWNKQPTTIKQRYLDCSGTLMLLTFVYKNLIPAAEFYHTDKNHNWFKSSAFLNMYTYCHVAARFKQQYRTKNAIYIFTLCTQ